MTSQLRTHWLYQEDEANSTKKSTYVEIGYLCTVEKVLPLRQVDFIISDNCMQIYNYV